jgi:hypothetical protein
MNNEADISAENMPLNGLASKSVVNVNILSSNINSTCVI